MGLIMNLFGLGSPEPIPNLSRNDPCWCGSGKKYKRCHLESDERKRSKLRAKTCKSAT